MPAAKTGRKRGVIRRRVPLALLLDQFADIPLHVRSADRRVRVFVILGQKNLPSSPSTYASNFFPRRDEHADSAVSELLALELIVLVPKPRAAPFPLLRRLHQ